MNINGFDKSEIACDLLFLLNRACEAGVCRFTPDRCTGISSNALVKFVYLGDHFKPKESEYPLDGADLCACERTFDMLPKHRKTNKIKKIMKKYRAYVYGTYSVVMLSLINYCVTYKTT